MPGSTSIPQSSRRRTLSAGPVRRSLLAGLLAALAVAVLVLTPATAAPAAGLTIRKVDTTGFPDVTISALLAGAPVAPTEVSLRENGRLVNDLRVVPIAQSAAPVGVVLAIDTSGSMRSSGRLAQ